VHVVTNGIDFERVTPSGPDAALRVRKELGLDGVLVPPADSAALADALAALVGDPARRSALAGRGRAKVVERFSFERMVRSYEALYERLLRG
jgi:glycosyltransferase involved in cell wall biosynthesis